MGSLNVKKGSERESAREFLSDLPRSGPTADRLSGKGSAATKSRFGQVRLSAELPTTLSRMRGQGSLGAAELKAAGWLIAIHDAAFSSTMRGVDYAERVSGSGVGSDGASAAREDARRSWDWARELMLPEVWDAVVGVCIRGCSLTGLDGFVGKHSREKERRQVAGTCLRLGLLHLSRHLGLTSPPEVSQRSGIPEIATTDHPVKS